MLPAVWAPPAAPAGAWPLGAPRVTLSDASRGPPALRPGEGQQSPAAMLTLPTAFFLLKLKHLK